MSVNLAEIRKKIGPELYEQLRSNPNIAKYELKVRKERFPSKDLVPNIAQEKSMECIRKVHPLTGDFVKENHFIAGNGIGKSADAIGILLAGCTLGPAFVHPNYFANHEFFHYCQEVRRKRALRVRVVCDASGVADQGPITQNVEKWIPCAKMGGKGTSGGSYFTNVSIPSMDPEVFHPTVVDIKTHGQPTTAHAGTELDVLIFDEPPPKNVYEENASRTRSHGYIFGFMTPLEAAPYLINIIDAPGGEGMISVTNGSIWDNCADIPGTRGILRRHDIEDQIRRWKALDPITADARIYGRFSQLAGAVFKMFRRDVHVIPPIPIQKNWNIFSCTDPHDVKPPFTTWMALTPSGDWFVIAESPTDPWDQISTTHLSIDDFARQWDDIERGRYHQFRYMQDAPRVSDHLGDPNYFLSTNPLSRRTYKLEYELKTGWDINVNIPDSIPLRHDRIKQLIKYDLEQELNTMNRPHLYVFDTCDNVKRAFLGYCWQMASGKDGGLSDRLEKKWMCPMSCVGYTVTAVEGWEAKAGSGGKSEYDEIRSAQDPDFYDPHEMSLEEHYDGERFC